MKRKMRKSTSLIEPDEIFLDSKNLENFDRQQFEGRIEKPIKKQTIFFVGIFFLICILTFSGRLGYLQIQKGQAYYQRSQNNTLNKQIIFADRGIIYDRNKKELVWNKENIRIYKSGGFSHVMGYVSYPMQDKLGNYWQSEFVGKDGLEKQYNDKVKGVNGSRIVEIDAKGKIQSENIVNAPTRGSDLVTTLDMRVQMELFSLIKNLSESKQSNKTGMQSKLFSGGAGVIIDINNGEVLTATSFPEYNSETLSLGKDNKTIESYINDKRKVFMDRTISGLYTPGSIVKPFFAIGALAEKIIDPYKQILSTGSISIPNPYFPDQKTIFKDWRINGLADMRKAIAVSHDIYFYEIGGGYQDQKGLGILNLEKYAKLFNIGDKTGVDLPDEKGGTIPSPEWKAKTFANDPWRIGDTYHTSIGQYGFQVTPMQMAKATAAIANNGILLTPHFILGDTTNQNKISNINSEIDTEKNISKEYFNVVREGMREAVTYGTAVALDVPYVQVAAKTGTAQLGIAKNKVNSWVIGFFPYENPKYAFTIMMEAGPSTNSIGATYVMRGLLDWMSVNTPEYFK